MQSSVSPTEVVDQVLAVRATRAENDRAFFALSPAQRAAAMWRALLGPDQAPKLTTQTKVTKEPVKVTMGLLYRWAARYPYEVPLVNGEFAFIAATTPEIADTPGALEESARERDKRVIATNQRDLARQPQRSIAARLRAEAERLRAIADTEATM